jgi:hypothetical protein
MFLLPSKLTFLKHSVSSEDHSHIVTVKWTQEIKFVCTRHDNIIMVCYIIIIIIIIIIITIIIIIIIICHKPVILAARKRWKAVSTY